MMKGLQSSLGFLLSKNTFNKVPIKVDFLKAFSIALVLLVGHAYPVKSHALTESQTVLEHCSDSCLAQSVYYEVYTGYDDLGNASIFLLVHTGYNIEVWASSDGANFSQTGLTFPSAESCYSTSELKPLSCESYFDFLSRMSYQGSGYL